MKRKLWGWSTQEEAEWSSADGKLHVEDIGVG